MHVHTFLPPLKHVLVGLAMYYPLFVSEAVQMILSDSNIVPTEQEIGLQIGKWNNMVQQVRNEKAPKN